MLSMFVASAAACRCVKMWSTWNATPTLQSFPLYYGSHINPTAPAIFLRRNKTRKICNILPVPDYSKIDFLSRSDKAVKAEATDIVSLSKNANIKGKQRLWKSQWNRLGNWRKLDIARSLMQQNAITFVEPLSRRHCFPVAQHLIRSWLISRKCKLLLLRSCVK